jgi:hypothetical protein
MALTGRPQTVRFMQMYKFLGVNNPGHVGLPPHRFPGSFFSSAKLFESIYTFIKCTHMFVIMI